MATPANLAIYIARLNELYSAVSERRRDWLSIAPSVLAQLRQTVDQVNSALDPAVRVKPRVYESDSHQGGKELSVTFPRLPFVRAIGRGNTTGAVIDNGASLHFVPTFAGRVVVVIFGGMPEFPDRPKSEEEQILLAEVEPTSLNNPEPVLGYVEKFFKYAFEKHWLQPGYNTVSGAPRTMGFRPPLEVAKPPSTEPDAE
jgi:hypothetical protein